MLRVQQYCLRIGAIVLGTVFIAVPSASIDPEGMGKTCFDYLKNLDDPEWQKACLDAMEQWTSQRPPVESIERQPPRLFPISQTKGVEGPHDGDGDAIVQALLAGEPAEIIVEFEVEEVRNAIHMRALEEGLRSLDTDKLAEKRASYESIKESGLAGLSGITVLRDFENLSMSFVRVSDAAALDELLSRPEVKAVHEKSTGASEPETAGSRVRFRHFRESSLRAISAVRLRDPSDTQMERRRRAEI